MTLLIRLLLLATSLAFFSGCASLDALNDPVDTSRRANISGTLTTGPMKNQPSLEQRGIRKLGLLIAATPEISFESVGMTMFQNKEFTASHGTQIDDQTIVRLFMERFAAQSSIALIDLSGDRESLLPRIKRSMWGGQINLAMDEPVEARIKELRAEGVDAILVIREQVLSDFIGGTNQTLAAKGVYNRFGTTMVFAGFDASIIDLKTLKGLKHASYVQASCEPISVTWKSSLEHYTSDDWQFIRAGIERRLSVNVEETMFMLKAGR